MARLDDADLSRSLGRHEGERRLQVAQTRLTALRLQAGGLLDGGPLGPPLAVLFEGWDASGKGGAIRRLTAPLDPRHVRVSQFSAPSDAEKRHHFLWRFAPALPGWGGMSVLDRTWYGRVLVERVEGFASEAEWERAYPEITAFEHGLHAEGMVLVKFWMHISADEQLRRFEERAADPLKRWKLTREDWRNRERRDDYTRAIEEMLRRTDGPAAPWHVVAAEDKHLARATVAETVVTAFESALRAAGIAPTGLGRADPG